MEGIVLQWLWIFLWLHSFRASARVPMDSILATRSRPGWVWFICIWYTVGFTLSTLEVYLALSHSLRLTPQTRGALGHLTTIDYVLAVVQPMLVGSAAVALFMLRRQATYLFWSAFGLGIASDVYRFVLNHGVWSQSQSQSLFHNSWVYIGMQLAVCLYCETLKRNGTLT
jgi:hypothetical protein